MDTDAGRLRGYGEVHPYLKEILDPSIKRLGHALLRMHYLISETIKRSNGIAPIEAVNRSIL